MANEEYFGLFQQFRPLGEGVEQALAGVPNRDQYVSRLLEVYKVTCDDSCAADAYFVVRSPIHTSDSELRSLGSDFVTELRALAENIGNAELFEYLRSIDSVEVVQRSRLNRSNDDNTLVMEGIRDWLNGIGKRDDPILRMREAFYSVACDFFLMYYLQWPYYVERHSNDVFRPYFELWKRGAQLSFECRSLQIG
jgi:hypothetical protein